MYKTKRISSMLAQRLTWYAEANSDISQIKDPNILHKFTELQHKNELIISSFLNKIFPDDMIKDGMMLTGKGGTYVSLTNFTKDKDIALSFESYATSTLIIRTDISVKDGDNWTDIMDIQTKPLNSDAPMIRYVKYPPLNVSMSISECFVSFLIPYKEGYLYFSNSNDLQATMVAYIENKEAIHNLYEAKFYIRDNGIEAKEVDLSDMEVGELFNLLLSKNYEVLYDRLNNRGLK